METFCSTWGRKRTAPFQPSKWNACRRSEHGTHPWTRAEGETAEGIRVRFTKTDSAVYAILLGKPKTGSIAVKALSPKLGTQIFMLGSADPLPWSQQGSDMRINLPSTLPGEYAYVLKIAGPVL
jgi:alpha-L-fucosidase